MTVTDVRVAEVVAERNALNEFVATALQSVLLDIS